MDKNLVLEKLKRRAKHIQNTTKVIPIKTQQQEETAAESQQRKIEPFPQPPVIERVETPCQKRERELQAQTMDVQRQNLQRLLERRLRRACSQANSELIELLQVEWRESFPYTPIPNFYESLPQ